MQNITQGSNVEFDSEDGLQTGTVAQIEAGIATVQVKGTLNNQHWMLPARDLKRIKG